MYFDLSPKSVTLLIFFAHGIVFSVLLLVKAIQNEIKASAWLSAFSLLCSLYISPFMFGYAGWYGTQPYRDVLFYFPFQQLLLLPPVLFFYTKSLLDKSFSFKRADFIHFIPAVIYLIYSVIIFITDKIVLQEYYFYADGRDKDLVTWYQIVGFISLVFYSIKSLNIYRKYKSITFDVVSFADTILFKWIQRFLIALLILLINRVLFFVLNPEWAQFGNKFWYYLCFSVLFYYISLSGYVNSVQTIIPFNSNFSVINEIETSTANQLNVVELEEWKIKLETLMTIDKAFQNPTLTLADVSEKLNISTKKISQIINQGFKMNFNDFVNYYRTEEVIKTLKSGKHNIHTLLAIAYDCGFNSKSTFNRSFKKQTGFNPKEYLLENKNK
jgi:AraC-like DNA-binding protein